jgi:hypothetical protein
MLTASGKFQQAQKVLFDKAMKASYKLYKEVNSLNPNVNTVLHLFDPDLIKIITLLLLMLIFMHKSLQYLCKIFNLS